MYITLQELSNSGIGLNETGNEFSNGIQYLNADVNSDGIVDFQDTFRMLQHLNGTNSIVDLSDISNVIKLIPKTTYNSIGKLNWNTYPNYLGSTYPIQLTGNVLHTFDISVTWVGDVNLSHSSQPTQSQVAKSSTLKSKSTNKESGIETYVITELVGNKVEVILKVNPKQEQLKGTQFSIFYDTSKLTFDKVEFKTNENSNNFGSSNGTRVSVGSLITDGVMDETTEYKIIFTTKETLKNTLGLIYVKAIDAVNKEGNQIEIDII